MVQRVIIEEMHDLPHLGFGIAFGSGIEHGKNRGDTVRREEEVFTALVELPIEIKGKITVSIDD